MPRTETTIDVMIGSPSDLEPEREAIEEVVSELNRTWSRKKGLRLNLLSWEKDTYPDFGEDAQDVINRQIGDNYDVFIGLLWARFGTPTRRSDSGTAEEFERALSRFRDDPESVKIMVYFKNAPISPDSDPEQLKKVQEFRRKVAREGGRFSEFTSADDLAGLLRIHLSRQVDNLLTSVPGSQRATPSLVAGGAEDEDDTGDEALEEGFLDLIEAGTSNFQSLRSLAQDLVAIMEEYGDSTKEHTEELNSISGDPSKNISERKKVIKKSADSLNELAEAVEDYVPGFREYFGVAMSSYGKATALLVDFGPQDAREAEEALEVVRGLRETLVQSLSQLRGFRESVESVPRVTTEYNRAKKRAIAALRSLEGEMDVAINSAEEVTVVMEATIAELNGGSRDGVEGVA